MQSKINLVLISCDAKFVFSQNGSLHGEYRHHLPLDTADDVMCSEYMRKSKIKKKKMRASEIETATETENYRMKKNYIENWHRHKN